MLLNFLNSKIFFFYFNQDTHFKLLAYFCLVANYEIAKTLLFLVFLPESMKKHGYFAYVNAKDYDLEFNGQVHVRLKALAAPDKEGIKTDATDMFRLTKDGFLGLTKQLDRETQSQYIICINATDKGARPRFVLSQTINFHQ